MDETVKEFLVESHENLDRMNRDLLDLEKSPTSANLIASVFRAMHTLKGTAGFLGFPNLGSLAHAAENLLARVRDDGRPVDAPVIAALLSTADAARTALRAIEAGGEERSLDEGQIATLTRLASTASADSSAAAAAGAAVAAPQVDGERGAAISESSVRVGVGLLDRLMNLVGELVLARNQVLQIAGGLEDTILSATSQRLDLITSELQESVMKTRMQPIGNAWSPFPRLVRDVALACGKRVAIEMDGRDTELDRTILEAIKDPLTHLVRNAVDHGIEAPAARATAGKPAEGRVSLRAFHEGGQVVIEVADDGAGIDVERVKRRAIQRGIVTADRASRMSERDLLGLVFVAGFSTADEVTSISGRGVGMDVVRTNVERIGGTVDVQSRSGQGTTFRIKIPLTLAIIPALIVTSAGELFAIPQANLLELVRLEGADVAREIATVHGAPLLRLRGNLLPVVHLDRLLGLAAASVPAPAGDSVNIVVLQAEDRQFGLVVQQVNDTEEIVVKPLARQLKGLGVFAGATILGDGRVALILDVLNIAQRVHVVSHGHDAADAGAREEAAAQEEERQPFLLCRIRDDGRIAIPLPLVSRLEEFQRAAIERVGGREVVQYRGRILPLVRVSDALPERRRRPRGPEDGSSREAALQVVVHQAEDRMLGLVVDQIVDVVYERIALESRGVRRGVLGCAVIQERVTELLDVSALVAEPAAPAVRAGAS